jgi:hypothetical protein
MITGSLFGLLTFIVAQINWGDRRSVGCGLLLAHFFPLLGTLF